MLGEHTIGSIKADMSIDLTSPTLLKKALAKVCEATKLRIVKETYHQFVEPPGVTYCAILSQSHFILHTWPERHTVLFDLFSCDPATPSALCVKELCAQFKGTLIHQQTLRI